MEKTTTFLMFDGKAEEAMNFYTSLFSQSQIISIVRYGTNEMGKEGSVKHAIFSLSGIEYRCIDTPVKHNFTFTPAISIYVSCDSENEVDVLFVQLSKGGQILMPLGPYPHSAKFAWVADKYDVSWQLSFDKKA